MSNELENVDEVITLAESVQNLTEAGNGEVSEVADEVEANSSLLSENSMIDERILRAVKEMGFESLTPIQEQTIPLLLDGKDVIGQAQTGTGKTAAFGIPLLQKIDTENSNTQAIILCPTRELAIQAAEELRKFAKYMHGVKVLPVYGGQDIMKQIRSLKSGISIVVGTPGRVMDHMRRHTLKLDDIRMLVLDEADEMLNMGFREDIETILKDVPSERQTALFSATMPKEILEITHEYQKEDTITVKTTAKELTIPLVKQYYYEVGRKNKLEAVARLLDYYNPKLTLIFCNTKQMVDELAEALKGRGYFADGLHGDLSQFQRDRVMNGFRNKSTEILIATDVAARGIDVDDVEAVINFDVPQDIEYYVHRIGRTGRAGKTGRAFTLVVGKEIYKIRDIERTCNTKMKARSVPSYADITAAKSEKILLSLADIIKDSDLTAMKLLIEQKMSEEEYTAIEIAAAFLKQEMGEELEDIPTEKYEPYSRERRDGRGSRDGGRSSYGRGGTGDSSERRGSYGRGGSGEGGNRRGSFGRGGSGDSGERRDSYGRGGSGEGRYSSKEGRGSERRGFRGQMGSGGDRSSWKSGREADESRINDGEKRSFAHRRDSEEDTRKFDGEKKSFGRRRDSEEDTRKFDGEKKSFGSRHDTEDGARKSNGEKKSFGRRKESDTGERKSSGNHRKESLNRDGKPYDHKRKKTGEVDEYIKKYSIQHGKKQS